MGENTINASRITPVKTALPYQIPPDIFSAREKRPFGNILKIIITAVKIKIGSIIESADPEK